MENNKDKHVNWMDQVSKDYNLDEEIKRNPGFGKPLPNTLFSGDTYSNFTRMAKNAGYLPSWVSLQKEIRDLISKVIDKDKTEEKTQNQIIEINEKIKKYNGVCPPNMQRGFITAENIESQYKAWE
ncbi:DnaJ family domain-containing protein [Cytobacillus sp. FJAT-54145]|uniref:DnaJ family domain-containing protein n=1 Tax=Cytobacillus spartinae TaxID=3299023 RepID=A0ABW6KEV6_9BACI